MTPRTIFRTTPGRSFPLAALTPAVEKRMDAHLKERHRDLPGWSQYLHESKHDPDQGGQENP